MRSRYPLVFGQVISSCLEIGDEGNGSLLSRFQRSLEIARSKVTSAVKVCAFITFLVGVGMTGQKLMRERVSGFSALKQMPLRLGGGGRLNEYKRKKWIIVSEAYN